MAKAGKKETGPRQPASRGGAGGRAAKAPAKGRASRAPEVVAAVEVVEVRPAATPAAGTGASGGEVARHLRDALADVAALRDELRTARAEVATLVGALKAEALDGVRRLGAEVAALRSRVAETRADGGPAGGAGGQAAAEPEAKKNRFGATVAAGVVIADVAADSPADAAGLLRGDVIEEANGHAVHSGADLRDRADRVAAGEELTLQLRRGGELLVRTVKLGEPAAGGGNRFGVTVAPGVVVAAVFAGSPAAAAGLARGDVIEEADGQVVHSGDEFLSVVHARPEGADVGLVVTRTGERRELVARLDGA
jgi:hypothetical protein